MVGGWPASFDRGIRTDPAAAHAHAAPVAVASLRPKTIDGFFKTGLRKRGRRPCNSKVEICRIPGLNRPLECAGGQPARPPRTRSSSECRNWGCGAAGFPFGRQIGQAGSESTRLPAQ